MYCYILYLLLKKGLKLYGDRGEEAVYSEMQQLHDMECIEPRARQMLKRALNPFCAVLNPFDRQSLSQ